MIKMLHFADVHIGMENYGKTHPGTGLSSRVMDFLRRMDEMCEYARTHDVDLTVFAGDAFKTRNPNPTFQREFAHRILELAELGPVVLLVGNHDLPTNLRRATSIEIYETLRVPNVYVGMNYELLKIPTKSGMVQVATAPYPVRARLLEDAPGNVTVSQLDAILQEELQRILEDLAKEASQSDDLRVLTGHFTIAGAVTGSERQVMLGRDVAVLLSAIANPVWDYVAMGHIHKFQDLTKNHASVPPVVYSGSMERIDFGEEADQKGFVWVELERGNTRYEFIPLEARPFITLRLDVRKSPNPTQHILDAIAKYDMTEAIVRLLITCDADSDALLKPRLIEEAVMDRGASNLGGFHRDVERPTRLRLGANPEGLTPPELLERFFKSKELSAEQISTLMEKAIEIFQKVEDAG